MCPGALKRNMSIQVSDGYTNSGNELRFNWKLSNIRAMRPQLVGTGYLQHQDCVNYVWFPHWKHTNGYSVRGPYIALDKCIYIIHAYTHIYIYTYFLKDGFHKIIEFTELPEWNWNWPQIVFIFWSNIWWQTSCKLTNWELFVTYLCGVQMISHVVDIPRSAMSPFCMAYPQINW